jgi:tRNA/rRNA methyltransferase
MTFGIVLVSPKYPGNVGSVLRVAANFGIRTLTLVDPRADLTDPDLASLAQGGETRVKMKVVTTLARALKPFQAVVATSSGRGRHKPKLKEMADMPAFLDTLPARARVALLFGAEDRGLSQEEMALAHGVFRIPTAPRFPVMNLAQAAAVTIFTAVRAPRRGHGPAAALADGGELHGLFTHMREVLLEIGFLNENNPDRIMKDLKNICLRALLSPREVLILRGILHQVHNYPHVLKTRARRSSGSHSG